MASTPITIKSPAIAIAAIIATIFAYFCYRYQLRYPFCVQCDPIAYIDMAHFYQKNGISNTPYSVLRLYGFPYYLAQLFKLEIFTGIKFNQLLFASQLIGYFLALWWVARGLAIFCSRIASKIFLIASLLNFFVYPYFSTPLSDGLSTILLIAIVGTFVPLHGNIHSDSRLKVLLYSLLMGLLCGFAIMVRPANIDFLGVPGVYVLYLLWKRHTYSLSRSLPVAFCIVAGFSVAVSPQIYFNYYTFHRLTFLPTYDLGNYQVEMGIKLLKYATNVSGGSFFMPYRNPLYNGEALGVIWYFSHPLAGISTIFLHLFAALDFDYLFTYVYERNPWYRPVLFIWSHAVLFWGTAGLFFLGVQARRTRSQWLFLLLLMSGAFLLGWCGIYGLSAPENRFALPVYSLLLPLALWAVSKQQIEWKNKWLVAFIVYLAIASQISMMLTNVQHLGTS